MEHNHTKENTVPRESISNLLQHQIKHISRDTHEFLGLLGELAHERTDYTSPQYGKLITTTLHSISAIESQLEVLCKTLERERLIHNDLYVQNTRCIPTVSKSHP